MSEQYAQPNALISTEEVGKIVARPEVRILEVDWEPATAYNQGHVRNALLVDWRKDMNHPLTRDIVDKAGFEALMSRLGVTEKTPVILYGDFNNWFAAYAFWVFKYYGHEDLKLMNGGRKKWIEEKREMVTDIPPSRPSSYKAKNPDESIRAYYDYVKKNYQDKSKVLMDVRSPAEYKGDVLAPPEYPTEHAQRGGHIPGAINRLGDKF